jgi:hypothetical protein
LVVECSGLQPKPPWLLCSKEELRLRPWPSSKFSQSVTKSMLLLFGCWKIGVNYIHTWPPPQSKMVLQLYACCEPGWSRRLFTEICNHWKI